MSYTNGIFECVHKNRIVSLKEAFQQTANCNEVDEVGMTPLHWAAYYGHIDQVEWMCDDNDAIDASGHGINKSIVDMSGKRAIDWARKKRDLFSTEHPGNPHNNWETIVEHCRIEEEPYSDDEVEATHSSDDFPGVEAYRTNTAGPNRLANGHRANYGVAGAETESSSRFFHTSSFFHELVLIDLSDEL